MARRRALMIVIGTAVVGLFLVAQMLQFRKWTNLEATAVLPKEVYALGSVDERRNEIVQQFASAAGWDLETLALLHHKMALFAIMNAGKEDLEGFSAQVYPEVVSHFKVTKELRPNTICEIGFNAGHSAATFLSASAPQGALYFGFDLHQHRYGEASLDILDSIFPGRVYISWGDSTKTVVPFFEQRPHVKCDLIHVDGGHFGNVPIQDLRNMMKSAHKNTVVLIDDVHCAASWCQAPQAAWDQAKAEGWIKEIECRAFRRFANEPTDRGLCSGKYMLK